MVISLSQFTQICALYIKSAADGEHWESLWDHAPQGSEEEKDYRVLFAQARKEYRAYREVLKALTGFRVNCNSERLLDSDYKEISIEGLYNMV